MDRKRLFDEDPAKYELRRPNYGAQVFADILAYSSITAGCQAIEVGPGPGGTLALFWNRPAVDNPDDPLHRSVQAVYDQVSPHMSRKDQPEDREAVYDEIDRQIAGAGFVSVERKLYRTTREFTGAEYIELLDTYSDHRALEEGARARLYDGIRRAIEQAGDRLVIHDTVDLHLGRKL